MTICCPGCNKAVLYDHKLGGKTLACPHCKGPLLIPSLQQLPVGCQKQYRDEQARLPKQQETQDGKLVEKQSKTDEEGNDHLVRNVAIATGINHRIDCRNSCRAIFDA